MKLPYKAPLNHFDRVKLANTVLQALTGPKQDQFLQAMEKVGKVFGINFGLHRGTGKQAPALNSDVAFRGVDAQQPGDAKQWEGVRDELRKQVPVKPATTKDAPEAGSVTTATPDGAQPVETPTPIASTQQANATATETSNSTAPTGSGSPKAADRVKMIVSEQLGALVGGGKSEFTSVDLKAMSENTADPQKFKEVKEGLFQAAPFFKAALDEALEKPEVKQGGTVKKDDLAELVAKTLRAKMQEQQT